MVGWSRRSSEDDARARRYRQWFNSLPPEEQERIERERAEQSKRNKPGLIITLILGFLFAFVGWPLVAIQLGHMRWQRFWNAGKVVSEDTNKVCKEVTYCRPCSPLHHWHKEVICRPR